MFFLRNSILTKSFSIAVLSIFILRQEVKAQSAPIWKEANASIVLDDAQRYSTPISFRTTELDIIAMRQLLSSAPKENLTSATRSDVILSIPMPDGSNHDFRIWETAVMAPGLASRYPDIKTYIGEGVTDRLAVARFDVTNFGFHAMILSSKGNVFIDPVSNQDDRHYISYYKRDLIRQHDFSCGVDDDFSGDETLFHDHSSIVRRSSGDELRTYRLALACTGEYAAEKGGTVNGAMSGMVTSMNRVNGIYEQELAIRMELIVDNTLLIYLNGATDPYTNNNGGAMLDQNQENVDDVIGTDNYDIGHVFSTNGGGIAQLGAVCQSEVKAMGVTGTDNPVGDAFDVDYVAHEMGHQFGANHTFNSTTGSCSGNRWGPTAFEPGSGSTIMSYAGICGTNNLQLHSDAYFHSGSYDEILDYVIFDFGGECPAITSTGNTPPVVTVGSDYSIPLSTPFRLDATATDADGDALTFMWDEMDHGPGGNWNNPLGAAPLFRSLPEDTLTYRYFPKLSTVIANYISSAIGEVLPDYARTINFRFIARDHNPGTGGVTYNDNSVTLTVVNTTTPFRVTFPNVALTWAIGTPWGVSWDVSSTNVSPINCQNVNILLSIDGGYTYPIVLASNTPNDGSEVVTIPNDNALVGISTARVMVQSVGNVFFDISNHNFTITNNVGISDVPDISSMVNVYPNPVNNELTVVTNGLNNEPITVQVTDLLGRILFDETEINVTGEKKISIDLGREPGGIYLVEVSTRQGSAIEKVVKQ